MLPPQHGGHVSSVVAQQNPSRITNHVHLNCYINDIFVHVINSFMHQGKYFLDAWVNETMRHETAYVKDSSYKCHWIRGGSPGMFFCTSTVWWLHPKIWWISRSNVLVQSPKKSRLEPGLGPMTQYLHVLAWKIKTLFQVKVRHPQTRVSLVKVTFAWVSRKLTEPELIPPN